MVAFLIHKLLIVQVRLYDPRAQRRPVINMTFQDEALTCLTATSMEKYLCIFSHFHINVSR